jgi:hypothetical protein
MISRNRSAPTAAAISIEWTTSAKRIVTCLNSAGPAAAVIGEPQEWQNRAFSSGSAPHTRQVVAVIPTPPIRQIKRLAKNMLFLS